MSAELRAIRIAMYRDYARALRTAGAFDKAYAWDALANLTERRFS